MARWRSVKWDMLGSDEMMVMALDGDEIGLDVCLKCMYDFSDGGNDVGS
jgi:hypothetical protein